MEVPLVNTGNPARHVMLKPMNCHGHPRLGALMRIVAPHILERFGICVAMPNPKNFLITSHQRMVEYHRALSEITGYKMRWLMKLYFTEALTPQEFELACRHPDFAGLKYYPRGLTTNSDEGISDPSLLWKPGSNPFEVLRLAAQAQKPTSYHGADGFTEDGDELDPYAQEEHFFGRSFPRVLDAHPDGIHIAEHLSTITGMEFFRRNAPSLPGKLGCTVTAHHPALDRRDVYRRGFRPMYFCWPVIQPSEHMQELRVFTTAGYDYVMLGDDGAGHPREAKECGCCAGGVYTAPVSIELYTELFAAMRALHYLEKFASLNGPRFYGVRPCTEQIVLVNKPWTPSPSFTCDDGTEMLGYEQPDRGKGSPPLQWCLA